MTGDRKRINIIEAMLRRRRIKAESLRTKIETDAGAREMNAYLLRGVKKEIRDLERALRELKQIDN